MDLTHKAFLRGNLFLKPFYAVFTKILPFINVFLFGICSKVRTKSTHTQGHIYGPFSADMFV